MNAHIDFERSIQKRRLIYKGTLMQRLIIFGESHLLGILLLIISLLLFIYLLLNSTKLAALLAILPILFIIISMMLINKLVKTEGTELRKNQTEIIGLLLRRFPGIQRHNCSEKIILITNAPKSFTIDKEILILLENQNVYMNITMAGFGNIKYVTFAIPNYLRSKLVLRKFYKRIKEQV
ncbi:hypothetical protein ACX0G9_02495 [Flavitalea flava]